MQPTESIWLNGKLVPWHQATTHVLTHTLHYGGGAFEGIRVYKTDKGPAVFRLSEHIERLFYTAQALRMDIPFTRQQIIDAVLETLRVNKLQQGYIRPLVYYGYGIMGVRPIGAPIDVAIACWPWAAYLPHDSVDVKVSKYIRIHKDSTVVDAKICGHYVNSILATLELRDTDYHEALLLDSNGFIAEGPGENFFLVKDNVIVTPKLGTILAGITRSTIMELATDLGYQIAERDISLEEMWQADEAFFTGTAAEVTPINSVDKRLIGKGGVGPVSQRIKQNYLDLVAGKNERYVKYLTFV